MSRPAAPRGEFRASFAAEAVDDLRRRLDSTRWPDAETTADWSQGLPLAYTRELADYWRRDYDFSRVTTLLNGWPQQRVELELDGQTHHIHCLHRRSSQPDARPLLITHGWPGSVLEFYKVIDALAEPAAHGAVNVPAFHVIAPTLPGYGFSSKPLRAGVSVEAIADLWDALMQELAYERYFAQGGDWGSVVTCALAQRHAPRCGGIHLNMVLAPPDPDTFGELTAAEEQSLARLDNHVRRESSYAQQQATRPQTLGYALADSPVGQLAWIVEKFWAWTDCERKGERHPEHALSRDEILDQVSLYWLTNSAASSARLYWESYQNPNVEAVNVPMGGTLSPKDIFPTSERWARKRFTDLRYWNELPQGGHFAALEQPDVFIEELRRCFATMDLA